MKTKTSKSAAPFAYLGLDRVIHERARLSVLTSLITHPGGLSFVELKQLCDLTDGNSACHLQVLEEDGIIRLTKEADAGRAQTTARITALAASGTSSTSPSLSRSSATLHPCSTRTRKISRTANSPPLTA